MNTIESCFNPTPEQSFPGVVKRVSRLLSIFSAAGRHVDAQWVRENESLFLAKWAECAGEETFSRNGSGGVKLANVLARCEVANADLTKNTIRAIKDAWALAL